MIVRGSKLTPINYIIKEDFTMWVKIRTVLVAVLLNEVTLKALATGAGLKEEQADAVAGAVMDVKAFVDTKDRRYINQSIDKLQTLIK